MTFYNETKLLYVETNASRVGLGAILLQKGTSIYAVPEMRHPTTIY